MVTRAHNARRYLPSFLRHYRTLGADRFVVIDDRSSDGSRELLTDQPDVLLLPAVTSYREARRGRDWFNAVLMELEWGQRVVPVDIDEYLVFSDGTAKLRGLFDAMRQQGLDRISATMVDFYPPKPVSEAIFDGSDETMPWEVAPLFDASGYSVNKYWHGPVVQGGPRRRLFDENVFLTKFPVMFNERKAIFDHTIHAPQPMTKNWAPVGAALLHFKYFSDFVDEHERIVERGSHAGGGKSYQAVLDRLDTLDNADRFDFAGAPTRRYEGPKQLCELGLIEDIVATA